MLRSLIAAAVALVALSSPALARHHRAHHQVSAGYTHHTNTYSGSVIVDDARRYLGAGAVFGRATLWCARFMNHVLQDAGYRGTGSDMARSFLSYGTRVYEPRVGAIAVFSRGKRSGHVGVVSGIASNGDPIVISGNHNHRVAEARYPKWRVLAYVIPSGPKLSQAW